MHKIIIDTDPGIDDAQAIAFALAHPQIDLLALTTVFGNASVELTTRNALVLLERFGFPEIPVAKGAARPLAIKPFPAPDFVHGQDGMGNLNFSDPTTTPITNKSAAEFIVDCANEFPGEVTVIAIGPLTNIALAVELDPQLPSKLKSLVIMGGTVNAPGNVSPVAEANFINDPHAADVVCSHDWPLTIIGLDVTMQVFLTQSKLAELRHSTGDVGDLLWKSGQYYMDFYNKYAAPLGIDEPACAMHDASAVVYAVRPDLFSVIEGRACVATDGAAMGQLIVDHVGESYVIPYWEERPALKAAMQIDDEKVIDVFIDTIRNELSTDTNDG